LCIISSVIIGSVNCWGLAEKIKRGDIFSICKERYDITVLTDTHCCLENESHRRGVGSVDILVNLAVIPAEAEG
jgi:hypothetical protein